MSQKHKHFFQNKGGHGTSHLKVCVWKGGLTRNWRPQRFWETACHPFSVHFLAASLTSFVTLPFPPIGTSFLETTTGGGILLCPAWKQIIIPMTKQKAKNRRDPNLFIVTALKANNDWLPNSVTELSNIQMCLQIVVVY